MGYTFARVGAVVGMKVEDYYIQKRRGWVRLHEKGGKEVSSDRRSPPALQTGTGFQEKSSLPTSLIVALELPMPAIYELPLSIGTR